MAAEGRTIKSLFLERSFTGYKALALALVSIVMMAADHQTGWLVPLRSALATVTAPFYVVTQFPYSAADSVLELTRLHEDNQALRDQLRSLAVEAQRSYALLEENQRLRALLGSSAQVDGQVTFADVIGIVPQPSRRSLILGKGYAAGVFEGQAVLDSDGLMGQVVEVGRYSSRLMLITDTTHVTPVLVNRNDYRAMLYGTGDPASLELRHVPQTADVIAGDLLVTSGLDQRFPSGYPVATVVSVELKPGEPFLHIRARPTAALERSRHLVLVTGSSESSPPANERGGRQ